ncbi:ROK family glucokinase [Alteribacillus bidgolensis]|uniref:Glucokinase n=1 Tax=Alteribacillus bidgolensis TaxID=930129 RepID=A0A1G8P4D8_9BACI|nr:ROK family glucokinase [Alteribacillus bidgolensis]SDI87363.1 glucokinase [Alteribacillus bidgolensis]
MEAQYVLGIDVGGTSVKLAVLTVDGNLLEKWNVPTNKADNGAYILKDISSSVKEHLLNLRLDKNQFIGAGIGVPGFINMEKGMVDFAVNIGWRDYPIVRILSDYLDMPVVVDNDANLAAAGEYWKGAGTGADDLIMFTIGTGVGGGIIVKGDILHGVGGMGGEIGHVTVVPEGGTPCNCGKAGCLETVSSATGIVRIGNIEAEKNKESSLYKQKQEGIQLTTKNIFEAAVRGDQTADAVIEKAMYFLGLAAANIANVLNPQKIVIGGGVSAAGEQLLFPLRNHYDNFALERVKLDSEFALAELGNDAGVMGAAWLAKTYLKD